MKLLRKLENPLVYRLIIIGTLILIFISIFFFISYKHKLDEESRLKNEYNQTIENIDDNTRNITKNRAATQKLKDNANILEQKGIKTIKEYLDVANMSYIKSTDDIKKQYDLMLRNDVSKELRDNEEFKKIHPPKKYNIYPGTQRSNTLDFYIENTGDDTLFTNNLIVTYDLAKDEIVGFKTFRQRGDE